MTKTHRTPLMSKDPGKCKLYPDRDHLREAIRWLCRAQSVTGCGGVSGAYSIIKGWLPPYPQATGYIIPTLLGYALLNNEHTYIERAISMGDWEISIQLPSGAVTEGMGIKEYPIVFDTGQVILGWISLYKDLKHNRFLNAAIKAADWLVSIQDVDGKWSKYTRNNTSHAYHSRVSWPLLEVSRFTNDKKYKDAALKNILWVLTCAKENGYFDQMSVIPGETPLTHTIGYTLHGLMESSVYLAAGIKEKIMDIVLKASEAIMMKYELMKKGARSLPMYLPATLDENWTSVDNYSCLTGNSQIALLFSRLYSMNNDIRFLNAALKLNDQVKMTQSLNSMNQGIRGGIAGSFPIEGKYFSLSYPSWSAKFFADSIMIQEKIMRELEKI